MAFPENDKTTDAVCKPPLKKVLLSDLLLALLLYL